MKQPDNVLSVEDQSRIVQRVLKSVQHARLDMPPAPLGTQPRELIEFMLRHYALARVEADRAAAALRVSLSSAEALLDVMDSELERRFDLAEQIRQGRESIAQDWRPS